MTKASEIKGNKTSIFSWCPDIEEGALNQMKILSELPFIDFCALMPDAHKGMTMPIGGVIACRNVIIPNAVGVDISCGLGAVKTNLKLSDFTMEKREELLHSFKRSIPTGFGHNSDKREDEIKVKYEEKVNYFHEKHDINTKHKPFNENQIYKEIFRQLGTLGKGNHFLEVQHDEEETIWIMVHSGSRNIGKMVCDFFNRVAQDKNKLYFSGIPEEIPFLPAGAEEGHDYIKWMNLCMDFAFLNRKVMLDSCMKDLSYAFKNMKVQLMETHNIHHNFASLESHFGQNYWIHRKGATQAFKDTIGIIPGSMGTPSYIVRGLGEKKSMMSCSHGAGRRMGRSAFNVLFNTKEGLEQINDSLKDITRLKFEKGKNRKGKETGLLDVSESPFAYKDIDEVMKNQEDLVEPIIKLTPLICLKDN